MAQLAAQPDLADEQRARRQRRVEARARDGRQQREVEPRLRRVDAVAADDVDVHVDGVRL